MAPRAVDCGSCRDRNWRRLSEQIGRLNAFVEVILNRQPTVEAPPPSFVVRVVDEGGQPVPAFQLKLLSFGEGNTKWTSGVSGQVTVRGHETRDSFRESLTIDAVVRADGYATTIARFTGLDREVLFGSDFTIVLQPGRKLELHFDSPEGLHLPNEWMPDVCFPNHRSSFHNLRQARRHPALKGQWPDYNFLNLRPLGENRFEVQLAKTSPPIYVAVDHPGCLQFFEAGPFTTGDNVSGVLDVDVPEPASLSIYFDPGMTRAGTTSLDAVQLRVLKRDPTRTKDVDSVVFDEHIGAESHKFELEDVSPGTYRTTAKMWAKKTAQALAKSTDQPIVSRDSSEVTLQEGETHDVFLRYVPLDRDSLRGDWTARIRIVNFDGSPAAFRTVTVDYRDERHGHVQVFSGRTSRSGDLVVSGLSKRQPNDPAWGAYQIQVNGMRLGELTHSKTTPSEPCTFPLPPNVGDVAPNIDLVNITTGNHLTLRDFRDRVVCIELWATWCGPCQEPLQKLNQMAMQHNKRWGDRVAVIGVSIDEAPEEALRHVQERSWDQINYFWSGSDQSTGFNAPVMRAFVLNAIPHLIIIDRRGRILWSGIPHGQNIAGHIDKALRN